MMYYEEQVINGVLCYRGEPDEEWTQYTPEELTAMVQGWKELYENVSSGSDQDCDAINDYIFSDEH